MTLPSPLPVIPVIDVSRGRVVRAVRGERSAYRPIESPLVAGSDPADVARALLRRTGGSTLYVADLDALQGGAPQAATLAALLAALPFATLWIDAGFAEVGAAGALRRAIGAPSHRWRAVYGSESLADAAALVAVADEPDAILSLDCRHARPLDPAGCWQRADAWPATLIVMTLDRVGAAQGPDLATFAALRARAPGRRWIGAGGVRHPGDLAAAAAAGAHGWLVASALHDGGLPAAR